MQPDQWNPHLSPLGPASFPPGLQAALRDETFCPHPTRLGPKGDNSLQVFLRENASVSGQPRTVELGSTFRPAYLGEAISICRLGVTGRAAHLLAATSTSLLLPSPRASKFSSWAHTENWPICKALRVNGRGACKHSSTFHMLWHPHTSQFIADTLLQSCCVGSRHRDHSRLEVGRV